MYKMNKNKCFECEAEGVTIHQHHVVPRSRGGTKTIPLCEPCHSKAHHRKKNMNTSSLVKQAMAKRKAAGAIFGSPSIRTTCQPLGAKKNEQLAIEFASSIESILNDLIKAGYKTTKQLCCKLNELGVKTRTGGHWSEKNLYRIRVYIRRMKQSMPDSQQKLILPS